MSDKVIRWTTVDGECVTHHAMRADDGGEQCIRCHALTDTLHVGFLCGQCKEAELQNHNFRITALADDRARLRGSTVEQRFCEPPVAGSTPAAGFLTDAERDAIGFALCRLSGTLRGNEECDHYDTLSRLLVRFRWQQNVQDQRRRREDEP